MDIEMDEKQKKLYGTIVFVVKLVLFSVPMHVILNYNGILLPLQEIVARNVYHVLKFYGFEIIREGIMISGEGMAFFISEDCTGWKSMLFMAALMLSVPGAKNGKRFAGILFGIPLVYAGNLMRILAVAVVWRIYGYGTAGILHDYLWQIGLVSIVIITWIVWLRWAGKLEKAF